MGVGYGEQPQSTVSGVEGSGSDEDLVADVFKLFCEGKKRQLL